MSRDVSYNHIFGGWYNPFFSAAAYLSGDENMIEDSDEHFGGAYAAFACRLAGLNEALSRGLEQDASHLGVARNALLAYLQGGELIARTKASRKRGHAIMEYAAQCYPRYAEWSREKHDEHKANSLRRNAVALSLVTPRNAGYLHTMEALRSCLENTQNDIQCERSRRRLTGIDVELYKDTGILVSCVPKQFPLAFSMLSQALKKNQESHIHSEMPVRCFHIYEDDFVFDRVDFREMMDAVPLEL